MPAHFGIADIMVTAQQPGRTRRAERDGHNDGRRADEGVPGREREQADDQGARRDDCPVYTGSVGTMRHGFTGVLTESTPMINRVPLRGYPTALLVGSGVYQSFRWETRIADFGNQANGGSEVLPEHSRVRRTQTVLGRADTTMVATHRFGRPTRGYAAQMALRLMTPGRAAVDPASVR